LPADTVADGDVGDAELAGQQPRGRARTGGDIEHPLPGSKRERAGEVAGQRHPAGVVGLAQQQGHRVAAVARGAARLDGIGLDGRLRGPLGGRGFGCAPFVSVSGTDPRPLCSQPEARAGDYLRQLEGCAVMSGIGWIHEPIRQIGAWMPCPVRVFGTDERDDAVACGAGVGRPV